MKISEIFPQTQVLLAKPWRGSPTLQLDDYILLLEKSEWAAEGLRRLFAASGELEAKIANLTLFKDFLSKRWARLKDIPSLHYTVTYHTRVTQIFEMLASELAAANIFLSHENGKDVPTHRYGLLMPTLDDDSEMTLSFNDIDALAKENQAEEEKAEEEKAEDTPNDNRHTDPIRLNQFILDRNYKPIFILDCLRSASEDEILRHTYLLDEDQKELPLKDNDIIRVTHHSQQAYAFYAAIRDYNKEKRNHYTAGGALTLLIDGLHKGDVHHEGTELLAGASAYAAIKNFYHFLKQLTPANVETIYALHDKSFQPRYFKLRWYHLLYVAIEDKKISIPKAEAEEIIAYVRSPNQKIQDCAYLIANCLHSILESNSSLLYKIQTQGRQESSLINQKKAAYEAALKELRTAQRTATLQHFSKADLQEKPYLTQQIMQVDERAFVPTLARSMVTSLEELIRLIHCVPKNLQGELIEGILKRRCITHVVHSIEDLCKLFAIFQRDPALQKTLLTIFNPDFIKHLVDSSIALHKIKNVLHKQVLVILENEILGANHITQISVSLTVTHAASSGIRFFKPIEQLSGLKRVASDTNLPELNSEELELPQKRRRTCAPAQNAQPLTLAIPDAGENDEPTIILRRSPRF